MAENARYQSAKACAEEVLEALYSIYWADSFDSSQLEQRLAKTIFVFTKDALHLSKPKPPMPGATESTGLETVSCPGECPAVVHLLPFLVSPVVREICSLVDKTQLMQLALPAGTKDQPASILPSEYSTPEILRLLAIGSPPVVDDCVKTLFRLSYARPEEWSPTLPTANPGEVMRILTKRIGRMRSLPPSSEG